MKMRSVVVGVITISIIVLLVLHLLLYPSQSNGPILRQNGVVDYEGKRYDLSHLMHVLQAQNDTISSLISLIEEKHPAMTSLLESIKLKDAEIERLNLDLVSKEEKMANLEKTAEVSGKVSPYEAVEIEQPTAITQLPTTVNFNVNGKSSGNPKIFELDPSPVQDSCEKRYGVSLIDVWRNNEQEWCATSPDSAFQSKLKCFPLHQEHKKLDGRGPDLFCEAENFFMDFSKIHGDAGASKPPLGHQYLDFSRGSLISPCSKTAQYRESLFMPHHALQMASFTSNSAEPAAGSYEVEEVPTYLLARDEDCENAFHSTADFMGMFLVLAALDIDPRNGGLKVILFDKHTTGPFEELIKKGFSPGHPLLRHSHYQGKMVLFKKLVFHLESPAGLIFPKVSRPDPLRCYSTSLFQAYRKFILQAFNLWGVAPPPIPSVTLTLRHRTQSKNVGRVMANEDEVVQVLRQGNMMQLQVVDFAKMSFTEQITLVRSTNVLVGIHGAGLMLIMFAAEEAILVEIHPSYRQDRHFRHAARMTGKVYMPVRNLRRETCHGTSDNVEVPIDEFRRTMDGALRIARNFDDGLSECGLDCPAAILALDPRLDPHYRERGETKGASVNTHFPC